MVWQREQDAKITCKSDTVVGTTEEGADVKAPSDNPHYKATHHHLHGEGSTSEHREHVVTLRDGMNIERAISLRSTWTYIVVIGKKKKSTVKKQTQSS